MIVQDELNRQAFVEEAQDLLAELETALLEIEERPEDRSLVDRIFRAMHTIKGSGAMFGFDDIASFTHDVESVFDKVRNGEMELSPELLDLTLKSRDHIAYLLQCATKGLAVDVSMSADLTQALRALLPGDDHASASLADEMPSSGEVEGPRRTYRVRFKPHPQLFLSGTNPLGLVREIQDLGRSKLFVHFGDVPALDELDPEQCHVWWDVLLTTDSDEAAIRDIFLFVEDDATVDVRLIDEANLLEQDGAYKRLGEILLERGDVATEDLRRVLEEQRPIGELLAEAGIVTPDQVASALAEQKTVRELRRSRTEDGDKPAEKAGDAGASIRVSAAKLDYLVDLVGELVIVQSQIARMAHEHPAPGMLSLVEALERLSDDLRDTTLGVRMLPIGTTFSRFRRLVRDLAGELGKSVELVTLGGETELDKTVIERLGDPLVHCLRNSLDHGVESPERRLAAGKSATGRITLAAAHAGGEVLVTISDDGAGIDAERIYQAALRKGIIAPEVDLSTRQKLELIFAAGFSTAEKVTNVSGRGVGMDVVKRAIESLRGRIELESTPGKGTVITIRLPLTLAIIDGLQVRVGDESYIIPLPHVEECAEHNTPDHVDGRQRIINLRGDIVPFIRLRDVFRVPGVSPGMEQLVVVNALGSRFGLVVDCVIGEHQTVIKSLGKVYKDIPGISGATIQGDGSMALIIDVPGLVHTAALEAA